jgi:S-adenosylmethionine-diacylglycerol 3-amino-3-carboxypropyl transferase
MPPQVIEDLWRQVVRVGGPGTRVIFRTAGEKSPVEAALPPEVRTRFHYDAERSRALHAQDRSAIYGMFHLYEMLPAS